MAKIPKREPERQQINPDQAESENTPPVDTDATNACDHHWVFHMSVPVKDEPDKRIVYFRCDKCNKIRTMTEDCNV